MLVLYGIFIFSSHEPHVMKWLTHFHLIDHTDPQNAQTVEAKFHYTSWFKAKFHYTIWFEPAPNQLA